MKNVLLVLLVILIGALLIAVVPPPLWYVEMAHSAYMPLIYDDSPNPTATPTPKPPTPIPTELPDGLWMYIVRAGENEDGEFEIYAQVPGIDWELEGYKVDKTVYVSLWCDAPVCDVWPVPPEFPAECNWMTGEYCEVEKFIYPETAKEGCSLVYPFNCK